MATQAERSTKMRTRLLRATVHSLLHLGYTRTSTTEICRRAKVSRGAQLHHFPTKAQLVAAAVEQVFLDRMDEFQVLISDLTTATSFEPKALFRHLWAVYKGEAFYAWLELVVASRTDATLRRHVRGVDARFTQRAEMLCAAALGSRLRGPRDVARVTRLILATLDGLALHHILDTNDAEARDVLSLLTQLEPSH